MKTLDIEQGTPEWLAARAGMVTASRIVDVMAKPETAARTNYMAQIVAEILTNKPQGGTFTNAAMDFGTEQEPFARSAYEVTRGVLVDQVGFVYHPTIQRAGASPDGLVGEGLVEIKCPQMATHLQYQIEKQIPPKYQKQMLWQLACTEKNWCDFISFRPELPEKLQLLVIRFNRDDKEIKKIEAEVIKFLNEADQLLEKLNGL
jgi:putative phage-type endonuclease